MLGWRRRRLWLRCWQRWRQQERGAGRGWAEEIATEVAAAAETWTRAAKARPLSATAAADWGVPQPNGAVQDPEISSLLTSRAPSPRSQTSSSFSSQCALSSHLICWASLIDNLSAQWVTKRTSPSRLRPPSQTLLGCWGRHPWKTFFPPSKFYLYSFIITKKKKLRYEVKILVMIPNKGRGIFFSHSLILNSRLVCQGPRNKNLFFKKLGENAPSGIIG